jgi:hypothetical protein
MLLLLSLLGFVMPPRPLQPLRVAVEVADSLELPRETRRLLEAELAALFRPLPVRLSWSDDDDAAEVWLTIAARPAVRRVTRCRRGLHDHRLAVARLGKETGTGRVELWVDHVAHAVSGNWDRPPKPLGDEVMGRALGRVLAHELGHILLRQTGHDEAGLMQSSLSARDLIAARRGFTDGQRARLALALADARSQEAPPPTPPDH